METTPKKKPRRCGVCDKLRDEVTGLCPTPTECDKLRAPGQRLKSEQAATAERVRRAASDHARLGIGPVRLVLPGDEQRHAEAVQRAVTGWKRPRRASRRERVA